MSAKILAHLKELRFLQLTIYAVLFLIISPVLASLWRVNLLAEVFLLNSLMVTLSAIGKKIRYKWLLWSLWGAGALCSLLFTWGVAPEITPWWRLLEVTFTALLLLGCIVAIFAFIFQSPRVTLDTIFAAVMAYLLLALTFAQCYQMLLFWEPQSFKFAPSVALESFKIFRSEMSYFSLVTIATLGYGDIVPQTALARMLAVIEAVMGQFYVALLVAWLMGTFISQSLRDGRQDNQPKPNSDGEP